MKKILKKVMPKSVLHAYHAVRKGALIRSFFMPRDELVRFDAKSIYDGHFNVTYRGVRCIRCPFDYVMYQMILWEQKPDLVIEIGTSFGGGALYLADLMDTIGHGMVHTIDIVRPTSMVVLEHHRIKLFTDGWETYDLAEAHGFNKILVIDDASHMYDDTLGALNKFAPLVSIGSYFIVEDGIVTALARDTALKGGPLRASREFLLSNPNFEIDRGYCDMFGKNATFNVNGYLRRVE